MMTEATARLPLDQVLPAPRAPPCPAQARGGPCAPLCPAAAREAVGSAPPLPLAVPTLDNVRVSSSSVRPPDRLRPRSAQRGLCR